MRAILVALMAALAFAACGDPTPKTPSADKAGAVVFAAASLQDVLKTIGTLYAAEGHPEPKFSFAGSSALVRQLEQGAIADIFISADETWMDYAAGKALIETSSHVSLLTNRLVLAAPASTPIAVRIGEGMDLAGALKGGRLAIADPESVPAGKYAREALMHFGVWQSVEGSIARTENVRAALRFVETGDAAAGVVYATDAKAAGASVVVVGTFPEESHSPIIYPAALMAGKATGPGRAFLDFLSSESARKAFEDAGFGLSR